MNLTVITFTPQMREIMQFQEPFLLLKRNVLLHLGQFCEPTRLIITGVVFCDLNKGAEFQVIRHLSRN
jgi:hypothetical protein